MSKSAVDSSHRMEKVLRVGEGRLLENVSMYLSEGVSVYLSNHRSYPYLKEGLRPASRSFFGDHGEPIFPMIGDRGLSLSGPARSEAWLQELRAMIMA